MRLLVFLTTNPIRRLNISYKRGKNRFHQLCIMWARFFFHTITLNPTWPRKCRSQDLSVNLLVNVSPYRVGWFLSNSIHIDLQVKLHSAEKSGCSLEWLSCLRNPVIRAIQFLHFLCSCYSYTRTCASYPGKNVLPVYLP